MLLQEPNVIEVSGSNYVVGDIHGQFYDMLKMLHEVGRGTLTQRLQPKPLAGCSSETTLIEATIPSRLSAICCV